MSRAHIIGEQKGKAPIVDHNELMVEDNPEWQRACTDMHLAKTIGAELVIRYPRRHWEIYADSAQGVIVIACPSVSLTKGYYLHLAKYDIPELLIRAVRAAGEILERHGVTRGRVTDTGIFDTLPQTLRGDVVAADSAPDPLQKRIT